MRKTIAAVTLLGMLSATPALAGLVTYTPVVEPVGPEGDVGLYNPADPFYVNTVYVDQAQLSDLYTFQFALHVTNIYYNASSLHFSFMYDNSSIDVVGMHPVRPVGDPWEENNYETYEWPMSETGVITVHSLMQGFTVDSHYEAFGTSFPVPFMQVTLHVNSEQESAMNAFGIVAMTLVSHTYSLTLTEGDFGYFGGVIHEVPEPASATLLFGGLAALMGGIVRRRRR